MNDYRKDVIGGIAALLLDDLICVKTEAFQIFGRHHHAIAGADCQIDDLDQLVAIFLRHSEHAADHLHRQLSSDHGSEVEDLAHRDVIQDATGAHAEFVFESPNHARSKTFVNQCAQPPMLRVVSLIQLIAESLAVENLRST